MGWSARKLYYNKALSIADFFKAPVRYLKESNEKESQFEKPYANDTEYWQMHLNLPIPTWPTWSVWPVPTFNFGDVGTISPGDGTSPPGTPNSNPTPFGDIPRTHKFIFGDLTCSVEFSDSNCSSAGTGYGSIDYAPPHSQWYSLKWQINSDNPNVRVSLRNAGTVSTDAVFDVIVSGSAGAGEEATICGKVGFVGDLVKEATYQHGPESGPFGSGHLGTPTSGPFGVANDGVIIRPANESGVVFNCGCDDITISCDQCTGAATLSWDTSTSVTQINRNNSGTVAVTGGVAPFSWSVSGTGWSLASATTTARTNTVIAGPTACGSATIAVTDACDQSTTGYVMEPVYGQWRNLGGASGKWHAAYIGSTCNSTRTCYVNIRYRRVYANRGGCSCYSAGCGTCSCAGGSEATICDGGTYCVTCPASFGCPPNGNYCSCCYKSYTDYEWVC